MITYCRCCLFCCAIFQNLAKKASLKDQSLSSCTECPGSPALCLLQPGNHPRLQASSHPSGRTWLRKQDGMQVFSCLLRCPPGKPCPWTKSGIYGCWYINTLFKRNFKNLLSIYLSKFSFYSLKFYIEGLDVDTVVWMRSHWILGGDAIPCVSSTLQPLATSITTPGVREAACLQKSYECWSICPAIYLVLADSFFSSQFKSYFLGKLSCLFNQVILTIINSYSRSWWRVEIIKLTIHEGIFASQLIVLENIKVTRT